MKQLPPQRRQLYASELAKLTKCASSLELKTKLLDAFNTMFEAGEAFAWTQDVRVIYVADDAPPTVLPSQPARRAPSSHVGSVIRPLENISAAIAALKEIEQAVALMGSVTPVTTAGIASSAVEVAASSSSSSSSSVEKVKIKTEVAGFPPDVCHNAPFLIPNSERVANTCRPVQQVGRVPVKDEKIPPAMEKLSIVEQRSETEMRPVHARLLAVDKHSVVARRALYTRRPADAMAGLSHGSISHATSSTPNPSTTPFPYHNMISPHQYPEIIGIPSLVIDANGKIIADQRSRNNQGLAPTRKRPRAYDSPTPPPKRQRHRLNASAYAALKSRHALPYTQNPGQPELPLLPEGDLDEVQTTSYPANAPTISVLFIPMPRLDTRRLRHFKSLIADKVDMFEHRVEPEFIVGDMYRIHICFRGDDEGDGRAHNLYSILHDKMWQRMILKVERRGACELVRGF